MPRISRRSKAAKPQDQPNPGNAATDEALQDAAQGDEASEAVALRNKARTEYGITNADDLSDDQINEEIAAIDKQAVDAKKEADKAAKEDDSAEA